MLRFVQNIIQSEQGDIMEPLSNGFGNRKCIQSAGPTATCWVFDAFSGGPVPTVEFTVKEKILYAA